MKILNFSTITGIPNCGWETLRALLLVNQALISTLKERHKRK